MGYQYRERGLNLPAEIARVQGIFDSKKASGTPPHALAAIAMHIISLRNKLADQQSGVHRVGSRISGNCICVCGLILPEPEVKAMSSEEYQDHPGHRLCTPPMGADQPI